MFLIRKPVVAGSFYPENPDDLKRMVFSFIQDAIVPTDISEEILGVISPHAGYIYSGQCAAFSYKILQNKKFNTAFIIAPSHRFGGFKFSIGNFDKYKTPLGEIEVNKDFSEKLLANKYFNFIPEAHQFEHSLEVQLPFLQIVNPKAKIVPIIFGNQTLENAYILAEILAKETKHTINEIVFIVSSDLSHYYSADVAKRKDSILANFIKNLDEQGLWNSYIEREAEACGIGGILTLIIIAKIMGFDKVTNLKYMHSGEVNNDYSQVVGYLSSVIYK